MPKSIKKQDRPNPNEAHLLYSDPVCGNSVLLHSAFRTQLSGHDFFFCSETCRDNFISDPTAYFDLYQNLRLGGAELTSAKKTRPSAPRDPAKTVLGVPGEPGYIPRDALRESHIQRTQSRSRSDQSPRSGLPDPYGESVMSVDQPPDEAVLNGPPDDSVLGG
jgi:YHS domain-containing protein